VHCDNRRKLRDESGQVLVLAAIAMVVLIALTGFALDVGHAYLVQRQLQAATDAAALAGALELPDSTLARQAAAEYGPEPGKRNTLRSNDNANIRVETKCVTAIVTGCTPANGQVNAISVDATSNVATVFAKVVGFDSFTVKARATACSPCSVKPLDIMLVFDRTGSMCQLSNGGNDPACTKLRNAREGIKTFLRLMNPQFHHVGLAVLPPATGATRAAQCSPPTTPTQASYDSANARYLIAPLSNDYATTPGTLNGGSTLVDRVECQQVGGGRTGYAGAIDAARTELQSNGRTGVQKVIVFLSDGAANYGSLNEPATYRTQPCQAGVTAAANAKAQGMLVYSIGYDLDGNTGVYERCQTRSNATEVPNMNAYEAMQRIATDPLDTFYNEPDPVQLNTIFSRIATDIFRTAQLIDDSLS
jgi:Flp pilus assembly protein TadG